MDVADSDSTRKSKTTIFDLNDYCLLNIFNYLPLRDLLIFSSIDEVFQSVLFLDLKKKRTYNLNLNYKIWSLNDIHIAFNLIGPIVESFSIDKNNINQARLYLCMEYILEYCKNLTSFEIDTVNNFSTDYLNQALKTFKNLRKLKLRNCCLTGNHIKQLVESVNENLESLDLSENHQAIVNDIYSLKNLKYLNINRTFHIIKIESLMKMFENFKFLQFLDIQHIGLSDNNIGQLIKYCKNIETLKIKVQYEGGTTNLLQLSELNNLKHLHIEELSGYTFASYTFDNRNQILRDNRNAVNLLLKKLCNQLITLEIHFAQIDHDKGLNSLRFEAIFSIKTLETLNLVGYLSVYVIHWRELKDFCKNSNLKVLNFVYTNCMLDFSVEHFIPFMRTVKNLQHVNLVYQGQFIHLPFLDTFFNQLPGQPKFEDPSFTLKIQLNPHQKQKILEKPNYLAVRDIFTFIIDENLQTSYTPMYYSDVFGDAENIVLEDEPDEEEINDMLIPIIDSERSNVENYSVNSRNAINIVLNSNLLLGD